MMATTSPRRGRHARPRVPTAEAAVGGTAVAAGGGVGAPTTGMAVVRKGTAVGETAGGEGSGIVTTTAEEDGAVVMVKGGGTGEGVKGGGTEAGMTAVMTGAGRRKTQPRVLLFFFGWLCPC